MMDIIKPGYKAFNGYVFTEPDCNLYNNSCLDYQTSPEQRHRVFCMIIGVQS